MLQAFSPPDRDPNVEDADRPSNVDWPRFEVNSVIAEN
jgi:hypothetical protein